MQRGGAGLVAGGPKPASRTAFLALARLHAARQDSRPLGRAAGCVGRRIAGDGCSECLAQWPGPVCQEQGMARAPSASGGPCESSQHLAVRPCGGIRPALGRWQ